MKLICWNKCKPEFPEKGHFFPFQDFKLSLPSSLKILSLINYRTPLRKMMTLSECETNSSLKQRTSNKLMCVSVERESDPFRNTSVCLCGCLSTFTSYKKSRQKEAARKRETAHLNSPCAHFFFFLGSPYYGTQRSNQRCQTDTNSMSTVGLCRQGTARKGKKPDFVYVTVIQQKSPFGTD